MVWILLIAFLLSISGSWGRNAYIISFKKDGYLEIAKNHLSEDENLSFDFKTTLPDGLLLYQGGVVQKERWDHVILELVNGSIRISYNTDTVFSETAYVGQGLNDGSFHNVNLVLSNTKPYQATLSVDTMQSVTVRGTQPVNFRDTNTFYVGGVRTLTARVKNNLITGKSFVGCIKNFIQSRYAINFFYDLPYSQNVQKGCPRRNVCASHRCKYGTCVDLWTNYECRCMSGYTSPYCERQLSASFDGTNNSSIGYSFGFPIRSLSFQFNVKTGYTQGGMVYSGILNSFQIGIAFFGDHLNFVYGQPGNWRSASLGTNLTDGSWHHLNMTIKSSGTIITYIDRIDTSVNILPTVSHIGQHLYFGRVSANFSSLSQKLNYSPFTGCVKELLVNNKTVDLGIGQRLGASPLPKPGCAVDRSCSSIMCGNQGTCKTKWSGMECRCSIGYHGDRCENGTAATFNDNTSILLTLKSSHWTFGSSGSMKFRTRSSHGLLLYAGWFPRSQARHDYVKLEIIKQKLTMTVNLGSGEGSVIIDHIVTDDQWHSLEWTRKYRSLLLILDGVKRGEAIVPGSERLLNVSRSGEIFVNISSPVKSNMFRGCIKDLVLDTRNVNFLNPVPQRGLVVLNMNVKAGCVVKDPCHGYICRNGGRCLDDTGSLRCNCTGNFTGLHCERCITGHTGALCDKVIDLCADRPCQMGTCVFDPMISINNYTCVCFNGFTGRNCTKEINECLVHSPCKNNARCVDGIANYSCICVDGYTGRNCTIEIDECLVHSPCKNNGRCVDGIASYLCICIDGYTGRNCSVEIDECLVHLPCKNNARCVDGIANYSCICTDGYTGRNCGVEIDECTTDSIFPNRRCLNNGVCIDGVANYMCNCSGTGYRGLNCETDIDECLTGTHKCKNGTCINVPGGYRCDCFKFYNGTFCNNYTKIIIVNSSGHSVEFSPTKFWWVILIGLLIGVVCIVVLFLYLRKQTVKMEGVYLPGEEEIRMAKVNPAFGLINEECII